GMPIRPFDTSGEDAHMLAMTGDYQATSDQHGATVRNFLEHARAIAAGEAAFRRREGNLAPLPQVHAGNPRGDHGRPESGGAARRSLAPAGVDRLAGAGRIAELE